VADIGRLIEIIEPEGKALGFELVRVKMMSSEAGDGEQALQIMAEDPATGQLLIEQCAALSRRISHAIDSREEAGEMLIEGAYHLEVSSPGIDRPLIRAKDYIDWIGHEAEVNMVEGWAHGGFVQRTLRGILKGIDGDTVLINDRKAGEVSYPLEMVHSAKLVLTDRLIAATSPLDASDAEDMVEEKEEVRS